MRNVKFSVIAEGTCREGRRLKINRRRGRFGGALLVAPSMMMICSKVTLRGRCKQRPSRLQAPGHSPRRCKRRPFRNSPRALQAMPLHEAFYPTPIFRRNALGESPTRFLNIALRYSTPENPACLAISAICRFVVIKSSFTRSMRNRRISS